MYTGIEKQPWLKDLGEGVRVWVSAGIMDPFVFSWWEIGDESQEECVQMALGTPGQWRKAPCSGQYLCENDVTSKIYTLVK